MDCLRQIRLTVASYLRQMHKEEKNKKNKKTIGILFTINHPGRRDAPGHPVGLCYFLGFNEVSTFSEIWIARSEK